MDIIYDLIQNRRIDTVRTEVRQARHKVEDVDADLMQLEMRFERLNLMANAIWKLVKEKTGATDADLRELIEQLDMKDGRRDGRAGQEVNVEKIPCAGCPRRIAQTSMICHYCGTPNKHYVSL